VLIFIGLVVSVVGSLGAPLVPTVARASQVSLASAQWSLTITLLVGAVTTPILGRLGDGPHRRTALLAAIGAVVAGCALAALPLGFAALLTGRALQGVGLGLYLCRELVQLHGGRIWVESETGKGSRFKFSLPSSA